MFSFLIQKNKNKNKDNYKISREEELPGTTLTKTVLNLFEIKNFQHETFLPLRIAELKSNAFTPKELDFDIKENSDLKSKIKKFLIQKNFANKNWIVNNIASLIGVSGWLIYNSQELNILPIRIIERNYDINEQLVTCTIAYDDYVYNNQSFKLEECYELNHEKKVVTVTRTLFSLKEEKKIDWLNVANINKHLNQKEELNLSYIPVIIWPNLPNEKEDCAFVYEKAKALNLAFEYILLDWILTSPRILINEDSVGYSTKQVIQQICDYIRNNLLVTEFTAEDDLPIQVVQVSSKGKQLTDMYDWLKNDIYKESGVPISASIKGAQQNEKELTGLNIETNTLIEQQLFVRENALIQLIKLLIKFDQDVLNNKTFGFDKKVDDLMIDVHLSLTKTIKEQINSKGKNEENESK